jgi:hypothetical protein
MRRKLNWLCGERGGQLIEYALVITFFVILLILAADSRWRQGFSLGTAFDGVVGVLKGIVYSIGDLVGISVRPYRAPFR